VALNVLRLANSTAIRIQPDVKRRDNNDNYDNNAKLNQFDNHRPKTNKKSLLHAELFYEGVWGPR